jgi:hypothetical protein
MPTPLESRSNRLQHVLALDGPEFLGQAYLLTLGRPVDPEGFRNYDAQLRAGTSKLSILNELRASQEGRAYSGANALSEAPANQLEQVLGLEGPEFLGQAYLLMLGRPIDPEGFRNYAAQLRAGASKLSILAELRGSQEGRAYGANAPDPMALLSQVPHAVALPAASLQELLRMNGSTFVNHGFVSTIGRMPEDEIRRRYVAKLDAGEDKLQILLEILEENGGAATPSSTGLEEAIRALRGGLYPVATNIRELLALDDIAFVDCAYKTLLKRGPDAVGAAHYLQLIRSGASKMRIVSYLCFSAEGRKRAPSLPGLKRGILKYWLARGPLTGWWFRPIAQIEGDTPLECRVRAMFGRAAPVQCNPSIYGGSARVRSRWTTAESTTVTRNLGPVVGQ